MKCAQLAIGLVAMLSTVTASGDLLQPSEPAVKQQLFLDVEFIPDLGWNPFERVQSDTDARVFPGDVLPLELRLRADRGLKCPLGMNRESLLEGLQVILVSYAPDKDMTWPPVGRMRYPTPPLADLRSRAVPAALEVRRVRQGREEKEWLVVNVNLRDLGSLTPGKYVAYFLAPHQALRQYIGSEFRQDGLISEPSRFTFAPPESPREEIWDLYRKAGEAFSREDFPAALIHAEEAIRRFPGVARLYGVRANVRSRLGDRAGALVDFRTAVALAAKGEDELDVEFLLIPTRRDEWMGTWSMYAARLERELGLPAGSAVVTPDAAVKLQPSPDPPHAP